MKSKKDMTADAVGMRQIKKHIMKYFMQTNWRTQLKWASSRKTLKNRNKIKNRI